MKKKVLTAAGLYLLFLVFTLLTVFMDVEAIGPNGTEVGFASLNGAMASALGFSEFWYKLTEVLGIVALLPVALFGLLGLWQLIRRKSLKKVDKDIYCLAGFYVLMLAFYALFEVLSVNFRPVIIDGELEASYPSSHTMLAVCVMATTFIQITERIKNEKLAKLLMAVCVVLGVVIVIGRILAGCHWFTDIIGGLILSAALVFTYIAAVDIVNYRKK